MGALSRLMLVAAVAAGAAVAGVLLLGRAAPVHGIRPVRPLAARASFDPPAAEFGDRVVARLVVLADAAAVDAGRLRVSEDLAPLTQLGPARVTRATRGPLVVVSYAIPVACITGECLAPSGAKRLRLPAARVEGPRSGGTARVETAWPALELGGRVTAADLARAQPPLRADISPPALTWRIAPGTLSFLLDLAAALLAAAGVGIAAWQAGGLLRRARIERRDELELAVALVREAQGRPPEDRRRAVGLLARLLRRRDGRLAGAAGDLAWSRPKPSPEELAALAERVEREVGA